MVKVYVVHVSLVFFTVDVMNCTQPAANKHESDLIAPIYAAYITVPEQQLLYRVTTQQRQNWFD